MIGAMEFFKTIGQLLLLGCSCLIIYLFLVLLYVVMT